MKRLLSLLISVFIVSLICLPAVQIQQAYCLSSWDSRTLGWVTSVKKQTDGVCWAYAICATAETDALAHNLASEIDFSEGYLYALHNLYSNDTGEDADTADSPRIITNTALAYNSLALEQDYPYSGIKTYTKDKLANNKCQYTITSSGVIKPAKIKEWIANHGAVICGMYMPENYDDAYINNTSDIDTENHVVTVIGWDDNISAECFKNKPHSNGAWLCKNSWGTDAGENGYFWLSYNDPSISGFTGVVVEKKECLKKSENLAPDFYQVANISLDKGSADTFGIGKSFYVDAGTVLDSFSLLVNENNNYTYKIYFLNDIPSVTTVVNSNLIANGTVYSDFQDIALQTIDINLIVKKSGYIFIEIIAPVGQILKLGADDEDVTQSSYYLQHASDATFYVKAANDEMRIGLNTAYQTAPISSTENTTIKEESTSAITLIDTSTTNQTTQSMPSAEIQECPYKNLIYICVFSFFPMLFSLIFLLDKIRAR